LAHGQQPRAQFYFNTVDDYHSLVNFGMRPPADFESVPFFVGTAHGGYHVFPGMFGRVIEGHSTREVTDPQTIESFEIHPIANGGGPRGNYRSGLNRCSSRLWILSQGETHVLY